MHNTLLAALAGAMMATVLFASCSDDTMPSADAQTTCDCPEAEPPLAGRIVMVEGTQAIEANNSAIASAFCPGTNSTLLGGGCRLMAGDTKILLLEAYGTEAGYDCRYDNTAIRPNTIIATAICLVPPE